MGRNSTVVICVVCVALILIGGTSSILFQQREIRQLQGSVAMAGTGYASIVAEWTPAVPIVSCYFANPNNDAQAGGTLLQGSNGTFYVLTNAHMVRVNTQHAASCDVGFLDNLVNYTVGASDITIDASSTDAAFLQLPKDSFLTHLLGTGARKVCTSLPAIGDEMLMFGYPAAGSNDTVTVTEGIISGDEGDMFVTSAKIDDGNSGGATIDVPGDCYFGIPSEIIPGDYANMGRILKWETISNNAPINLSDARF
jgi:S1-C subfamily serine protease